VNIMTVELLVDCYLAIGVSFRSLAMGVLGCLWAGETARDRRKTDTGIFSLGKSRLNEREQALGAYMLYG
jgi:hypothetical protein